MCDIADGRCDIWEEYSRTARKQHKCMACDESIRIGDIYHRVDSLYDGIWNHWIHCMRCWKIWRALRDDATDWDVYIDPYLNCGETWHDPPPEIAKLAFALPGEIDNSDSVSSDI
jgi:hypothetical protein